MNLYGGLQLVEENISLFGDHAGFWVCQNSDLRIFEFIPIRIDFDEWIIMSFA